MLCRRSPKSIRDSVTSGGLPRVFGISTRDNGSGLSRIESAKTPAFLRVVTLSRIRYPDLRRTGTGASHDAG